VTRDTTTSSCSSGPDDIRQIYRSSRANNAPALPLFSPFHRRQYDRPYVRVTVMYTIYPPIAFRVCIDDWILDSPDVVFPLSSDPYVCVISFQSSSPPNVSRLVFTV